MLDCSQFMFNILINHRFKLSKDLNCCHKKMEILKTENQTDSHTKIDQDVVHDAKSYTSIKTSFTLK